MSIFNAIFWISVSFFFFSLTAAVIYFILILNALGKGINELNRIVADVRKKVNTITYLVDVLGMLIGGVESAKLKLKNKLVKEFMPSKAVIIGFFAGVKKGLNTLLGGE